jgi:hypothetical protein
MCSAHPAAQNHTGRYSYDQAGRGLPYTGFAGGGKPDVGQELENRLSFPGSGHCGPNQGVHHDQPRDPRLSVSGNGTPNVGSGAVLKAWETQTTLGRPERAGPGGQQLPAEELRTLN